MASTSTVTDRSSRAMSVGLSGDVSASSRVTAFSLAAVSGRLEIETPAARTIDDATARSNGRFSKLAFSALHLQALSNAWSLYLSVYGQAAGKNLDSSEKMTLGGANGVRAYPQGEASGDTGYVATLELRYAMNTAFGVLQPFVGYDAGAITINENAFGTAANRRHLGGYAAGVSLIKAADYQLKLTVAARGSQPAVSDKDKSARAWVHLSKYF